MKYFVAGHTGMIGQAIRQRLEARGDRVVVRTHAELDLTNQLAVRQFMRSEVPDVVILAAGRSGGVLDGAEHPSEYLYDNLMIAANVIRQAHEAGIQRLLYIGSAAAYPKTATQPIKENALMTGRVDTTNEPLALAKMVGVKLCEVHNRQFGRDYRCVTPTNVYGPGDDFSERSSHVIPGLLKRFHEAVLAGRDHEAIWGTGKPLRDFLFVDDMAEAALFVLDLPQKHYQRDIDPTLGHLNVGAGRDISIRDLSKAVATVTGFKGRLILDTTKPDGPSRKLLDTSRLARMGWEAKVPLAEGLKLTYAWFLENRAKA